MPSVQPSHGTPSRRPSSVSPTIWWPGTSGSFGCVSSPSTTWRSVRQTPQAGTRSSTWPAAAPAPAPRARRAAGAAPRAPSRARDTSFHAAMSWCLTPGRPVAATGRGPSGRYARAVEQTLPYGCYTDPEILQREEKRILRPAWQYVGHTGQLTSPGLLLHTGRPHARRHHTRPGRCTAPASSTSAVTAGTSSPQARAAGRRCSARTTHGRTGSTAGSAGRAQRGGADFPRTARPRARGGRRWGPFSSRTPTPTPSRSPGARLAPPSRSGTRRRRRLARPPLALEGGARRELKVVRRTSSSATTARSRIPRSVSSIDVSPRRRLRHGRAPLDPARAAADRDHRRAPARTVPLPLAEPRG